MNISPKTIILAPYLVKMPIESLAKQSLKTLAFFNFNLNIYSTHEQCPDKFVCRRLAP